MADSDYIQGIDSSQNTNDAEFIQGQQEAPPIGTNGPRIPTTSNPLEWSYTTVHAPHTPIGSYIYGNQEGASDLTEGTLQRGAQTGEVVGTVSPDQEQYIENNINRIREKQAAVYNQNFDATWGQQLARKIGYITAQAALTSPLMLLRGVSGNALSNAVYASLQPTTEPGESLSRNLITNESIGLGAYGAAAGAARGMNYLGANNLLSAKTIANYAPKVAGGIPGAIYAYQLAPDNPEAKIGAAAAGFLTGGKLGQYSAAKLGYTRPGEIAGENQFVENYNKYVDPQKVADLEANGITKYPLSVVQKTGAPVAGMEKRLYVDPETAMTLTQNSMQNTAKLAGNLRQEFESLKPDWTQEEKTAAHEQLKNVKIPMQEDPTTPPPVVMVKNEETGKMEPQLQPKPLTIPNFIDANDTKMIQAYKNYRNTASDVNNPPGTLYDLQRFKRAMQSVDFDSNFGDAAEYFRQQVKKYGDTNYPQFTDLMQKDLQDKIANEYLSKFASIKKTPQQNYGGPLPSSYADTFFGSDAAQDQMKKDITAAMVTDKGNAAQQAAAQAKLDRIGTIQRSLDNMSGAKEYQLSNRIGNQESNVGARTFAEDFQDRMRRLLNTGFGKGYFSPALDPNLKANLLAARAATAAQGAVGPQGNILPLLTQIGINAAYSPSGYVENNNNNQ